MKLPVVPLTLSILAALASAPALHAESTLVVVMSTTSGVDRLTREQVVNIFLGRFRQLPNGSNATPVDEPADHPLKALFYKQLVNKSLAEIRAYWSRLVFSGRTDPPQQAGSQSEVLQLVEHNPSAIGYLDSGSVPPDVKVVLDLGPLP